jgi:hypothetical protein
MYMYAGERKRASIGVELVTGPAVCWLQLLISALQRVIPQSLSIINTISSDANIVMLRRVHFMNHQCYSDAIVSSCVIALDIHAGAVS